MAKTFRPYQPDQIHLFPPSPRDWLADDHLIFFLSDLVDTLDLDAIYDTYTEERGYPPYHPLLMVKILLYGYARGIYSSRKLSRACQEDVAFRVLCAGNDPDFGLPEAASERAFGSVPPGAAALPEDGDGEARSRGNRRHHGAGECEQA
jgi:transposase